MVSFQCLGLLLWTLLIKRSHLEGVNVNAAFKYGNIFTGFSLWLATILEKWNNELPTSKAIMKARGSKKMRHFCIIKHLFASLIASLAPLSRHLRLKYCLDWSKRTTPMALICRLKNNYTLLFAKYYLYAQKLLKKRSTWNNSFESSSELQSEKLS